MLALAGRGSRAVLVTAALLCLGGCQTDLGPFTSGAPAATAPSAQIYDAWTTPPSPGSPAYPAQPARAAVLQPAPVWRGAGTPPPPPPPDASMPVVGRPGAAPCDPCAPPAVVPAPTRTLTRRAPLAADYTGCGLPCEQGISQWHVRGVVGMSFFEGTDPAEECTYFGVDLGRTFCGCWGLDLYYRYNTGRFTREITRGILKDGGEFHHVGAKVTYEKGFGANSRFYGWGGLGGGVFWTDKYAADDSGPEVFGEAGVGYVLSKNWRVRAGVNVHGLDTEVTRRLAANDGQSRWLWIVAPVIEIEADF